MLEASLDPELCRQLRCRLGEEEYAATLRGLQRPPSQLCLRLVGTTPEERRACAEKLEAHFALDSRVDVVRGERALVQHTPLLNVAPDLVAFVRRRPAGARTTVSEDVEEQEGEEGGECEAGAPSAVAVCALYVSFATGMSILRGSSLFSPGVMAMRGEEELAIGDAVEIRLLPPAAGNADGGLHVTRGSTADPAWDGMFERATGCSNLIAVGKLQCGRRGEIFSSSGVAATIDWLLVKTNRFSSSPPDGEDAADSPRRTRPLPSVNALQSEEKTGWRVWPQQLPSVLAALALVQNLEDVLDSQERANLRVLDMCAAPGGKTTALVDLLPSKSTIVALDRSYSKLRRVQKASEGRGQTVCCFRADSTAIIEGKNHSEVVLGPRGRSSSSSSVSSQDHRSDQTSEDRPTDEKDEPTTAQKGVKAFYHKQLLVAQPVWEAFFRVFTTQPDLGNRKNSEKKIFKAVLAELGGGRDRPAIARARAQMSREHVDCMVRLREGELRLDNFPDDCQQTMAANLKARDAARAAVCEAPLSRTTLQKVPGTNDDVSAAQRRTSSTKEGLLLSKRLQRSTSTAMPPPPWSAGSFDLVLCDAPCSAMGQRPLLSFPLSHKEVVGTANYQRRFLRQAVQACRVGGHIVFSTCTLSPEENEDNVNWFLSEHGPAGTREVELLDLRHEFGCGESEEKLKQLEGIDVAEPAQGWDRRFVFRFRPQHWDLGFFVAKFRKVSGVS